MALYALRRIAQSFPLLVGISIFAYLLVNSAPGSPILMLADPNALNVSHAAVAAREAELGLNQPLPIRYLIWLREALSGNLGYSYVTHQPVGAMLEQHFSATAQLLVAGLAIGLLVSVPLGVLAAIRRGTWIDYLASGFSMFAVSVPTFFLALFMIYLFSLQWGWLPTAGMFTLGSSQGIVDYLRHLLMPAVVLGLPASADLMRYTRSSMLETLRTDYVRTAKAKGLARSTVIVRHALRTALLPLITMIGLRIPQLLGGVVIIETIFQWPGMGLMSIEAIQSRDYPVLMGVVLVSAIAVLLANLLTDLTYAWVDPRIRLGVVSG